MKRFADEGSIIHAYCSGIKMIDPERLNDAERMEMCLDYVDSVNANIAQFIQGRPQHLTVELERIEQDFQEFWERIGAEGDLSDALAQLRTAHNASSEQSQAEPLRQLGHDLKRSIRKLFRI